MKQKLLSISVYILSIIVALILSIQIGAELITQYQLSQSEYAGLERHHLADDMGFGMLLMFGLIPEVIFGAVTGFFIGKKINAKIHDT